MWAGKTTMQFSSEFLVGSGIAIFLGLAAIAITLRPMNPSTKKKLEIICWIGAVCGALIALTNLPQRAPSHMGVLISPSATNTSAIHPNVEIGDSKVFLRFPYTFFRSNPPPLTFAQNEHLTFALVEGEVTITTKVLDRNGKVLVDINHNRWITPDIPQIFDWNYTTDALEVIAPSGRVVWQIRILPNHFQIQGEWWDEIGRGLRWVKESNGGASFVLLSRANDPDEPRIEPIFQYPSTEHPGQLIRVAGDPCPSYAYVMFVAVVIYGFTVLSCPLALLIF
jgi:hypothetical protein